MSVDLTAASVIATVRPTGGSGSAPGKQPRTGRLTGVPVLDRGAFCEQGPSPEADCGLTPQERRDAAAALAVVVPSALANLRDAIQDERITKLTQKSTSWGPLVELLFAVSSGVFVGAVVDVMRTIATATPYASRVGGWLAHGSKALRATFQKAATDHPAGGHVRFLELIREGLKPLGDALVLNALADLDDGALTALVRAYQDPVLHLVATYRAYLDGLLSRFDAAGMGLIGEVGPRDPTGLASQFQEGMGGLANGFMPGGEPPIFRKGELTWVTLPGGDRKLTIFEDYGLKHWYSAQRTMLIPVLHRGRPVWIPPDLQPFAVTIFYEKTGQSPHEVNLAAAALVDGNQGYLTETLARLAAGEYLDRMFLGMGVAR